MKKILALGLLALAFVTSCNTPPTNSSGLTLPKVQYSEMPTNSPSQ